MTSLRSGLAIWMSVAFSVILFASGIVLYLLLRSALITQFDASLKAGAQTLTSLVDNDGDSIKSDMAEEEFPQFTRRDRPDFYQIIDSNGRIIEQSNESTIDAEQLARLGHDRYEFGIIDLADGRPARFVAIAFTPEYDPDDDDEEDYVENEEREGAEQNEEIDRDENDDSNRQLTEVVTLVVARDTLDLNRTLTFTGCWIGIVTAMTLVAAIVASMIVSRIGLAPLETTARRIARIDIDTLNTSVDCDETPREIQSIIASLNLMLGRLQTGYERERNFSANVAHELRTPIAGLKTTIEVALSQQRESEQYKQALSKCLAISNETQLIIENLLTIAQIDGGNCSVGRDDIVLDELIRSTCRAFKAAAEKRRLSFELRLHAAGPFETDRENLKMILRNLVDNAVSYATENTVVTVETFSTENTRSLRIANMTNEISASDLNKMFDRFWCNDSSRSQTGKHSGIGLSLCRGLVRLLSGELSVSMAKSNQIEFEFVLPVKTETGLELPS